MTLGPWEQRLLRREFDGQRNKRVVMLKVRYSVCDFIWPANIPTHPVVGVGAVVVRDGRALIVKRAHEPRKGEWSLPGGLLELGESLVDAARREIKEETGLDVEVGPIIETFDRVHRDDGPDPLSLRDRRLRVLVERRRRVAGSTPRMWRG